MTTIYWAGDSTVKQNSYATYPQTGIGQAFDRFVKRDVMIANHAENGRSTKSFIDEHRLAAIYDRIHEGDFLFIQFGHNDEKREDASRYTDPQGEFKVNLEKFVNVARNKKAIPVFITPLERRCFTADKVLGLGAHSEYVAAMKQTADALEVALIDLYSLSRNELKKAGADESIKWYMHLKKGEYTAYPEGLEDDTHLKYEGAVAFGNLIAGGLKKLGGIYASLLTEEI